MSEIGMPDRRKTGAMERHAQTLLMLLVLGICGWVGVSINALLESNSALVARMTSLEQRLDEIDGRFDKYMTRIEANALLEKQSSETQALDHRISNLEQKDLRRTP